MSIYRPFPILLISTSLHEKEANKEKVSNKQYGSVTNSTQAVKQYKTMAKMLRTVTIFGSTYPLRGLLNVVFGTLLMLSMSGMSSDRDLMPQHCHNFCSLLSLQIANSHPQLRIGLIAGGFFRTLYRPRQQKTTNPAHSRRKSDDQALFKGHVVLERFLGS